MGLKSYDQDCQTAEEFHFWDDLYRPSQNRLKEAESHAKLLNFGSFQAGKNPRRNNNFYPESSRGIHAMRVFMSKEQPSVST
jgi:hypothetical protein